MSFLNCHFRILKHKFHPQDRFIGERRAVNLDPNCGWARGKADVLYVADAFAVMGKVNELLAAKK
jgi:hypothetical protein